MQFEKFFINLLEKSYSILGKVTRVIFDTGNKKYKIYVNLSPAGLIQTTKRLHIDTLSNSSREVTRNQNVPKHFGPVEKHIKKDM